MLICCIPEFLYMQFYRHIWFTKMPTWYFFKSNYQCLILLLKQESQFCISLCYFTTYLPNIPVDLIAVYAARIPRLSQQVQLAANNLILLFRLSHNLFPTTVHVHSCFTVIVNCPENSLHLTRMCWISGNQPSEVEPYLSLSELRLAYGPNKLH